MEREGARRGRGNDPCVSSRRLFELHSIHYFHIGVYDMDHLRPYTFYDIESYRQGWGSRTHTPVKS
jgi:hypothetical protein